MIKGSLFFGIGKGSGSLFGGLLMGSVGTRWTFRLLAIVAGVCAVGYTGFQVFIKDIKNGVNKCYHFHSAGILCGSQEKQNQESPSKVAHN